MQSYVRGNGTWLSPSHPSVCSDHSRFGRSSSPIFPKCPSAYSDCRVSECGELLTGPLGQVSLTRHGQLYSQHSNIGTHAVSSHPAAPWWNLLKQVWKRNQSTRVIGLELRTTVWKSSTMVYNLSSHFLVILNVLPIFSLSHF